MRQPFTIALILTGLLAALMAVLDAWLPDGGKFWDAYFTEPDTLDYFCEVSHPQALFRHKANTYSNLGYFLAGTWIFLLGVRDYRKGGMTYLRRHPEWSILFGVACWVLFLGSTLFHAGLTVWTEWADLAGVYCISLLIGCITLHRIRGLWRRGHGSTWPFVGLWLLAWAVACMTIFTVKSWYVVLGALALIWSGGLAIYRMTRQGRGGILLIASMATTLLAVMWFVFDIARVGCDPTGWLQPHSNWHFGAAASFMLYYRFLRTSTATHEGV